jgi:hypothetical protein
MGTDIHLSVERLDENYDWIYASGPIVDCHTCKSTNRLPGIMQGFDKPIKCYRCNEVYFDGSKMASNIGIPGKTINSWYDDRNYLIFAVLANVRNWHNEIEPISIPRGIPEDISAESLLRLSNEHSASWLSLEEVYLYDWDKKITKSKTFSKKEWLLYKQSGNVNPHPLAVIQFPGDLNSTVVSNKEMDQIINDPERLNNNLNYITEFTWEEPITPRSADFLNKMESVEDWCQTNPDSIRLVFDFDS